MNLKYLRYWVIIIVLSFTKASAQTSEWTSPEVEQMYVRAKDYLSKGGIKQAIVLLQQAIQLSPETSLLYRDLAYCYQLNKEYNEAYLTIEPLIKNNQADEQSYAIAGNALAGMGEKKKAKNTFEKGIKVYAHSGVLYHGLGKYYYDNNDPEYALRSWLDGIENDPSYHLNYLEAAKVYAGTDKPMWAIFYAEVFINMEKETPRSMEARRLMLMAYTKVFTTIGTGYTPKYKEWSATAAPKERDFENTVMLTLLQLAPIMSGGITTENLTMLRTRLAMEWMENYAVKFPYSLFTYHDKLLREGQFDAYNQWLFGKAENAVLFESWIKFNPNAMAGITAWMQQNRYYPTSADFYNAKEVGSLFAKKKK
ncbi:MAG TPA: tetratricopeptide repeat protein [Flavipsychrobacter sp.]|nr:tetratricopeptide repeat protein [Flavipsychrobacter sp.]